MQNAIPVEDLKELLTKLDAKIQTLEQQLDNHEITDDEATHFETLLLAKQNRRQRVAAAYEKQIAADATEARRIAEVEGVGRMNALRAEHAELCLETRQDINRAARALEPLLERVVARRKELGEIAYEFSNLYHKAHGSFPDIIQGLTRSGVVPGDVQPLDDASTLYSNVYSLLAVAVGQGHHAVFQETRAALDSLRFKAGEPTNAAAIDETGLDIGQRMAARRSGLGR